MRPLTAFLLGLLAAGCTVDSPPDPWLPVVVRSAPTGTLSEALVVAERQHAQGIECGTQYMFDMAALARTADKHVPELVEAIRSGVGVSHALVLLHFMQERALVAVPAFLDLSRHPDPTVRQRAIDALNAALTAADPQDSCCQAASENAVGRRRTTRCSGRRIARMELRR